MKRFLGMLLCLAVAFILFLITRPFLDPGDIPQSASKESIVERRCKQAGIDYSVSAKERRPLSVAPVLEKEIPAALKQYYAEGGINPSNEKSKWLLTRRFSEALTTGHVPRVLSETEVDVYPFSPIPNAYVVNPLNGGPVLVLKMAKESGRWKIDNVIPSKVHDVFLDMDLTNWDCEPQFDY